MKPTAPFFAIALAAFLSANALAQGAEAPAAPVPELKGNWTGIMKAMRSAGGAEGPIEVRFTVQDGELLRGEKAWKLDPGSAQASVDGQLVDQAIEPFVGVIDFDGRTVHLAEQNDGGLYTGRLTGPDTLELVYIEAGDVATAYRVLLTRTK